MLIGGSIIIAAMKQLLPDSRGEDPLNFCLNPENRQSGRAGASVCHLEVKTRPPDTRRGRLKGDSAVKTDHAGGDDSAAQ